MQNNIISLCKPYMFTNENINTNFGNDDLSDKQPITKVVEPKLNVVKQLKVIEQSNPKPNEAEEGLFFSPKKKDDLFWCVYALKYGLLTYDIDNSYKREKEEKISCIEKLRSFKAELKTYKLKLVDIEDDLLNNDKISMKSLIALCVLYKINLIYAWNNKLYFETINNGDDQINIIINEKKENKLLQGDDNIIGEKVKYYRNKYLQIENISKPLKAITAYSKEELLIIAKKLNITEFGDKITKKNIYEKISNHI